MVGWESDDKPALRRLLYEKYFRDDEPGIPDDSALMAIEGFGAYRPAQFADPSHPAAQRLPHMRTADDVKGTPFFVQNNQVRVAHSVHHRI